MLPAGFVPLIGIFSSFAECLNSKHSYSAAITL